MEQQQLDRWIHLHSLGIVISVFITLKLQDSFYLATISLISFSFLLFQARTSFQRFWLGGPANWVTSIRLVGVLVLLLQYQTFTPIASSVIAIAILGLDGLDGWLARRFATASVIGGYFDKEVDAFFVMVLSLLLYWQDQAGYWILGMGLVRYFYVIPLLFFKEKEKPEAKTSYGRLIAGIVISGLCIALALPNAWNLILLPILGGLLAYSFGRSFFELIGIW